MPPTGHETIVSYRFCQSAGWLVTWLQQSKTRGTAIVIAIAYANIDFIVENASIEYGMRWLGEEMVVSKGPRSRSPAIFHAYFQFRSAICFLCANKAGLTAFVCCVVCLRPTEQVCYSKWQPDCPCDSIAALLAVFRNEEAPWRLHRQCQISK